MAQWTRGRAGDALGPPRVGLSRWQAIAVCRQTLPIRSGVELETKVGERLGVGLGHGRRVDSSLPERDSDAKRVSNRGGQPRLHNLGDVHHAEAVFQFLGLDRIIGLVVPGNPALIRVLEKVGMRYEGIVEYFGEQAQRWALSAERWRG